MTDRTVTNTATDSLHATVHHAYTRATGIPLPPAAIMPPGAIEAQEANGQRELLASSAQEWATLPADIDGITADALATHGFELGGAVANDPLFMRVRLPDGWRLEPTDHPMWAKLLDPKGIKCADIFYKAAYYDRRAFLRWDNAPDTEA